MQYLVRRPARAWARGYSVPGATAPTGPRIPISCSISPRTATPAFSSPGPTSAAAARASTRRGRSWTSASARIRSTWSRHSSYSGSASGDVIVRHPYEARRRSRNHRPFDVDPPRRRRALSSVTITTMPTTKKSVLPRYAVWKPSTSASSCCTCVPNEAELHSGSARRRTCSRPWVAGSTLRGR